MSIDFRLNPLDKINNIKDDKVRAICTAALEEAQQNINSSKTIAEDKVVIAIRQNMAKL